jgi:hypothetical protein
MTFRLDEDIFEWLSSESKKKRGIPNQTLMNSLLKQIVYATSDLETRLARIESKLKLRKIDWTIPAK